MSDLTGEGAKVLASRSDHHPTAARRVLDDDHALAAAGHCAADAAADLIDASDTSPTCPRTTRAVVVIEPPALEDGVRSSPGVRPRCDAAVTGVTRVRPGTPTEGSPCELTRRARNDMSPSETGTTRGRLWSDAARRSARASPWRARRPGPLGVRRRRPGAPRRTDLHLHRAASRSTRSPPASSW